MPYKDNKLQKEFQREWYRNNKKKVLSASSVQQKKRQDKINKIKDTPCIDCKLKWPPYVMEFDHRPDEIKINNIAKLMRTKAWRTVLSEIEKCDIVCSNCHRVRTAKRLGKL